MLDVTVRWMLRSCVLAGPFAVAVVAALRPDLAVAAAVAGVPVVSGSGVGLLLTHGRDARHASSRPAPGETLRFLLWTGIPAAMFMIAVAAAFPARLRVLDYTGSTLLITCPAALILRWWFTQRVPRPVEMKVDDIAEDVSSLRCALAEAFAYAGRPWDGGGEHTRRPLRPVRHLHPVHQAAADTGPQQRVLGAAPLLAAAGVGEHGLA